MVPGTINYLLSFPSMSRSAFMLSLSFPEPELPPVLPERRELIRSEVPLPESPVFPDPFEARRAPRSSTALLSPSRRLIAAFFVPVSAFL